MIKIISLFLLFIIFGILFFLNRNHPKIQETFITAIAGVIALLLGVLFFSQNKDDIKREISPVYFKSNQAEEVMFFDVPVLLHYHLQQNVIWGSFVKREPNQAGIFADIPNNVSPLLDLQAATLLNHLFLFYSNDWYIKRESKSFPGFNTIRGQVLDSKNKDIESFSKEDLKKVFEKNIFYPDLLNGFKLSLPKGTKVRFQPYNDKDRYCQIQFYKLLFFNAKIKIYFSSYVVGLGNISYYAGISKPQKGSANVNDIKDYGTVVLTMDCTASFNKIIPGHPTLIRYKEWISDLFDDLYNTFDWSVCDNAIREYSEILAHQKAIDN